MLSTLPNLANKAFIIGFFLPTLLFVLALAGLFHDQSWAQAWFAVATQKEGWDSLAYFVVAVWGASVLLMMTNDLQLKLLEGYLWPVSKMAFLQRRQEARFQEKKARADQLMAQAETEGDNFPDTAASELAELLQELVREFPPDAANRLPTRLGNAIRAFEVYSNKVYGADSIPLWLHLSTGIAADFQSALDDARAQVNCAVNVCYFAALIVVLVILRLIWGFEWHTLLAAHDPRAAVIAYFNFTNGISLVAGLVAVAICWLVYRFAVELVYPWGDLVKAAFDCYLPDLAKKMGYELPETAARRQEFWAAVSRQAIYWDQLKPEHWAAPKKEQPHNGLSGVLEVMARLVAPTAVDK